MNRRAEMTLEEVIKLVLAVAGIAVLLLLAVNLYRMFSVKTEAEQAKIHLNRIEKSLKRIGEGETVEYILTGPRGWYLVGYEASEVYSNNGKYNSTTFCENKDCLCLCDTEDYPVRKFIYPFEPGSEKWDWMLSLTPGYGEIVSAFMAVKSGNVELDLSKYFVSSIATLATAGLYGRVKAQFSTDSFGERMNYFFYQQEPYGLFDNPGYRFCEKGGICIKTEGAKVSSYEPEAGFYVPWVGLNEAATNIEIRKHSEGYTIKRKLVTKNKE